ncbi:carboxypeptidase-like regulatory domain-containing protein, partial [Methanobrevibacter sp. TMH8]|uniref:beta strand repeat-containing protein n=1 Tax=Methanobrevibacter sp. TMH8 TaxID=2848611 RepID=UPI001CCA61CE
MFIKNKRIIPFILLLVAVLLLFSLSSVSAASFNSGNSSSDIQNFIDTGQGDDDIVLEEGDYIDSLYNLNVSRKVNIKSNGKVNIKSSTGGILFNITARNVQIFNLNISGYQTAIRSNIGGLSVIGNNITTNYMSINIDGSGDLSGISLENNTIISSVSITNYGAVYVNANSGSTVGISMKNNNITANDSTNSYVVRFNVAYCDNSLFFDNNNITGTGYGVELYAYSSNNTITLINNNITGNSGSGVYLSADRSNNTITLTNNNITGNSWMGVYLEASSSNNTITLTNNNIIAINSGSGIALYAYFNNNTISLTNNNITGAWEGVYLGAYSGNNTISLTNNNITGSYGVYLEAYSGNNTISLTNNNITANSWDGVYLAAYSSNNTILSFIGNNITGIDYAMYIPSSGQFSGLSLLNNTFKSDDNGLYFELDDGVLSDILVKGNTILAVNKGIGFKETGYSSVNLTVNYNRILADVGLDFTTTYDGSNFDYNWWGVNDISSKIIGFDTNNHYILNITNLTSLANVRPGDKVDFALLVLNTTLTNVGVENLPYFVITGLFNGESYNTTTDDLFIYQFTVPSEGIQTVDALVDDQYVSLEFNASKGNTSSTIVVPDNVSTGKTVNITGIVTDDDGNPLDNVVITVTVDGVSYNVTTDSNGRWILAYKPTLTGNINVSVSWAGNNAYNGFTNSTNFNVIAGVKNVSFIISSPTINQGEKTNIKVTLKDTDGNILKGKKISLTINKRTYTATTNNKGI